VQLTRKADGASIPLGAQQQSIARAENILVAHPLRVTSGLLALYPFDEGQGEVIHDRSGLGTPTDIKLPEKTALRWVPGGVKFDGVGIGGGNLPAPVRARLENVSAVTLELWLQWDGDEWPLHYVFTRTANGQARFWENAISQGLVLQTPADSQAWTSMFLKWVQQYGEQRRARGFIIRLVAVYGRVLTPVEIRQNMDAGPE